MNYKPRGPKSANEPSDLYPVTGLAVMFKPGIWGWNGFGVIKILNKKFLSTRWLLRIFRFFRGSAEKFLETQQDAAYRQFARFYSSYTSCGTRLLATVLCTQWRSVLPPRQTRKSTLGTYLRTVCSLLRYCIHHWPYFSFTAQTKPPSCN
jgi:hypothetical protein